MNSRVGFGYDIHRLKKGKKLTLGGVKIENSRGPVGHSDADVLVHAIIDSILGAFCLGDIGTHFPDTDPQFSNISSIKLLEKVVKKIPGRVINIDSTIITETPKLNAHIKNMQKNISEVLHIKSNSISIKATTNEGIGEIGKKQAIACYAVSLCEEES